MDERATAAAPRFNPPRLLRPFPLLGVAWLVALLPLAILGAGGAFLSALGLGVMAVVQPASALFVAHWWRHTLLSVAGWIALAVAIGAMPGVAAMREDAMVYLLPLMAYPTALAVTSGIRCAMWLLGRRRN